MNELQAQALKVSYDERVVLNELSLEIPSQKITALIGGNGSGKSTLLKTLARLLQPSAGTVVLDGRSIHSMPTREVARRMAILPQAPEAPAALTVLDLVSFGRYPHRQLLQSQTQQDDVCVKNALTLCGLNELEDRPLETLSGGQKQRAWIAMAIAQDTQFLLLDEPTTFLDMAHQIEVLELLRRLRTEKNRTIVMAVHDIQHAMRYADYVVALKNTQVAARGTPAEVITSDLVLSVFNVHATVFEAPSGGGLVCFPQSLASHHSSKD